MSEKTNQSIADSLETNTQMLKYIPYLIQDLWAMGCSLNQIISMVRSLNLPAQTTSALDLGCGKGAVSVNLAKEFGFHITGIDAMEQFLEYANEKAIEYNVSHLCNFLKADINDFIKSSNNFSIIIFSSLGGLLGTYKETIGKLRTQVKSGGYIIIDDGYLKAEVKIDRKGYEHYKTHDEVIKELTAFGDELIAEIDTTQNTFAINNEYSMLIKKRGEELIKEKPEITDLISNYVENQFEECEVIENYIEGALWLIRKNKN